MSFAKELSIELYPRKYVPVYIYLSLTAITFGVFYCLCKLSKRMEFLLTTVECNMMVANCIAIVNEYGNIELVEIHRIEMELDMRIQRYLKDGKVMYIDTIYGRFLFDHYLKKFVTPKSLNMSGIKDVDEFYQRELINSLKDNMGINIKKLIYGENVPCHEIKTVGDIIEKNFFNIYFCWELITVGIWIATGYYRCAFIIGGIYLFVFANNVRKDYRNNENMKKINHYENVKILRDGTFVDLPAVNSYPGDIVIIEDGECLSYDCQILFGDVIMDESFLTGEITPVCKKVGETLYSGTKVIKSRFEGSFNTGRKERLVRIRNLLMDDGRTKETYEDIEGKDSIMKKCIGLVTKTGKRTKRGMMGRNIQFKVVRSDTVKNESSRIIRILSWIASILFGTTGIYLFYMGLCSLKSFEYALDLGFSIFSPSIHSSIELGIQYSVHQLYKKGINTIDADAISMAGETDTVIFDKTGTLTELGVDLKYIDDFQRCYIDIQGMKRIMQIGLSTCHHVMNIGNEYIGDLLDTKMLKFSRAAVLDDKTEKRIVQLYSRKEIQSLGRRTVHGLTGRKKYCIRDSGKWIQKPGRMLRIPRIINEKNIRSRVSMTMDRNERCGIETADRTNKIPNNENHKERCIYDHVDSESCTYLSGRTEYNEMKCTTNRDDVEYRSEEIVGIVKTNEFDIDLKCISVCVDDYEKKKRYIFCKGAPDSLFKMMKDVPEDYNQKINYYGLQGYRVLTLAYKEIESIPEKRADAESDLKFLGLLVFSNQLRKETKDVLRELREGDVIPRMCTGDSILTAISVARDSGMVSEDTPVLLPVIENVSGDVNDVEWICVANENYVFDPIRTLLYREFDPQTPIDFVVACEGRDYEYLRKTQKLGFVLKTGVIYARFNPENKKTLVLDYIDNGLVTMYCGDGANDTGALSVANVGLSLATNESSLVASFNSTDLGSVLSLIKDGRASFVISNTQFLFTLFTHCICGVQMVSLLFFLYFPTDMMSLTNDIMMVYVLNHSIVYFRSSKKLQKQKPISYVKKGSYCIFGESVFLVVLYSFVIMFVTRNIKMGNKILTYSEASTIIFFTQFFTCIYKLWTLHGMNPYKNKQIITSRFLQIVFGGFAGGMILLILMLYKNERIMKWFEFKRLSKENYLVLFVSTLLSIMIIEIGSWIQK